MKRVFQVLIKGYTFLISPLLGCNCRYQPTCSAYAHEAIEKHGCIKGLYLTFRRIFRCHPWSKHPFKDPVPNRFTWGGILRYKRSSDK